MIEASFKVHLEQLEPIYFGDMNVEDTINTPGVQSISEGQESSEDSNTGTHLQFLESQRIPLAKFLPALSKLSHQVVNGTPNLFLKVLF